MSVAGPGRRLLGGLALIVVIAAVIAVVLLGQTSPSGPVAASAATSPSGGTTVKRRNLVVTDTQSGTLAYAQPQTVYNRLGGTITWLPAAGRRIAPGQTLLRVGDVPVILMDGATPAYRDLGPSDAAGPDILQLNRNLVRLGFNPDGIVVDDVWQAATTAGVDQFQASLGESETGIIKLGRVVFLPGPQLVSAVQATVGAGGSAGSGGASVGLQNPAAHTEFVSLTPGTHGSLGTHPSGSAGKGTAGGSSSKPTGSRPASGRGGAGGGSTTSAIERQLQDAIAALRAETAALRAARSAGGASNPSSSSGSSSKGSSSSGSGGSGSGGSGSGGSGSGGGAAVAVMTTTSTRVVVTVDLPASAQAEAHVGGHVEVQLPDNSTVPGVITAVSSVAQSSSGSGSGNGGSGNGGGGNGSGSGNGSSGASTVPVTIALRHHLSGRGLDQAAVSVMFAQSRANHVLSVPVTALIATSGSSYAVQEAAAPHKLIPVQTGLFAAGYVAISGPGIIPGLQVTDSQG